MKSQSITILALIIIVTIAGGTWLLANNQTPAPDNTNLTVAATIFPLADIAQNVGGDNVNVIQLLPSGADPHSYSLSPRQVADLQNAKVLFIIGHGLDNWAADAASRIADIPIIVVDKNLDLIDNDPHYWLTVPNAKHIAQTISEELIRLNPENRAGYSLLVTGYLEQLDELEFELQTLSQSAPQKNFIAVHNAWGYFADHYGLEQVGSYEPVEGQEPSANDLQELQSLVDQFHLQAFYDEPAKHRTTSANFIESDLGLTIRTLDDLGGLPPRDSYLNLMRANIAALTSG